MRNRKQKVSKLYKNSFELFDLCSKEFLNIIFVFDWSHGRDAYFRTLSFFIIRIFYTRADRGEKFFNLISEILFREIWMQKRDYGTLTFIISSIVFSTMSIMIKYSNGVDTTILQILYFTLFRSFGMYLSSGRACIVKSIQDFWKINTKLLTLDTNKKIDSYVIALFKKHLDEKEN